MIAAAYLKSDILAKLRRAGGGRHPRCTVDAALWETAKMLKSIIGRLRALSLLTWLLIVSAIANVVTAASVASLATRRLDVYVSGGGLAVQGDVEILNGRYPVKVEITR